MLTTRIGLVGLVVDPNGAAVVSWGTGATLYQATRPPGANLPFGKPTTIATDNGGVVSMSSNAAGRAVVVFYDGTGYSAATREPGHAFDTAVHITGTVKFAVGNFDASTEAVSADGAAAALVSN
jgi:hypothetical protein